MAGIIVVDRIESDASYASSINIASPLVVANTISIGSNLAINSSGINAASIGFGTLPSNRIVFESNQSAVKTALNASGDAGIFAARAWVNFNGTGTPAIRASGNVSSITDNGLGDYTVNFTTAMPDANYSTCANAGPTSASGNYSLATYTFGGTYSSSAVQISTYRQASGTPTLTDYSIVSASIFR